MGMPGPMELIIILLFFMPFLAPVLALALF